MEISGKYHISSSPGVRDVVSAFQVMGSSRWWEARGETLWTLIVNRSCRLIRPGQCLIQASCNSRIGQPLNLYPSSNNCNMEEFLTIVQPEEQITRGLELLCSLIVNGAPCAECTCYLKQIGWQAWKLEFLSAPTGFVKYENIILWTLRMVVSHPKPGTPDCRLKQGRAGGYWSWNLCCTVDDFDTDILVTRVYRVLENLHVLEILRQEKLLHGLWYE